MSQNPIGIIVNPKSGKDVRRIVSHASTITNFEKVNILKRILLGIIATGARWVVYMPDSKDLVGNATDPKRFNDEDLLEREASYGKLGFSICGDSI